MQSILANGTVIEALPTGSRVTLPCGAIIIGEPQDDDDYRLTARRLGYGTDTLTMCCDHDPLHAALCAWLGLSDSHALNEALGRDTDAILAAAEEEAVLAVQRFMRLAGGRIPA